MRVQARRCDFVSYMLPARRCTCQAAIAPSTVARVSVAAYFKFIVQSPSAHGPCIAMGIEPLFLYVGSCGAARCGSRRSREERTAYAAVKLPSAASNARVQYCHLSRLCLYGDRDRKSSMLQRSTQVRQTDRLLGSATRWRAPFGVRGFCAEPGATASVHGTPGVVEWSARRL